MKYLCLDFGGTGVKYAIIDENFQLYDVNKENKIFQSHDEMITWVVDLFKTIHMKLSGIAISYCGEMNPFTGLIKNGGSYRFNDNKNIKQILWSKCHVPVSIENDGNCAALAELYRGSLKETSNGAVLVLGTGVGCAIIINGELYRGCNYFAGAATFSLIDSKHDFDWQNTFGLIGGVGYLTRNYEKRFALELNSIDGLAFFNKANHNDIASLEILRDYTKNLARYIFNMQMLLDLENISIGGGISTQPLLLTMLKKEVSDLFDCIPVPVTPPEIKVCHYYNDANLIGAFCWYKKANF